jgi:hypothetical protein
MIFITQTGIESFPLGGVAIGGGSLANFTRIIVDESDVMYAAPEMRTMQALADFSTMALVVENRTMAPAKNKDGMSGPSRRRLK